MTVSATLQKERAGLHEEATALLGKAKAEVRPLTAEERSRDDEIAERITGIDAELKDIEADAQRFTRADEREKALEAERKQALAQATRATSKPDGKAASQYELPTPFKGFGEFLKAVAIADKTPYATDPRLLEIEAAALGLNEAVPSEGGFLVQTDFTGELLERAHETGKLVGRVDTRPISANSNGLKINAVDEASRVDGSRMGGMQAYWTAEAGALTATKPTFRQIELSLQKLTGLYYATDEELQDTTALAANIARWFGKEFGFKLDDALIRGSGAGAPLGILAHAGTVSVAKETGQGAASIVSENIHNMYARVPARSLGRAVWHINQDCWPQLFGLSQVVGLGGVPVFVPAGGISQAPFGTLLGRPVDPLEHCETLGTVGDIILADWQEYIAIDKGGIEAASSIHVQFLTGETAFRFILRFDGQPKANAVLTPYKGTKTQSPFVTLATRA